MLGWYRRRWLDLVASIYMYNEHRGYTALDRVLAAVRSRYPDDPALKTYEGFLPGFTIITVNQNALSGIGSLSMSPQ